MSDKNEWDAIVRNIEKQLVTPREKVVFKDRQPDPITTRKSSRNVVKNKDGTFTTPLKTYTAEEYDKAGQRAANLFMAKVSAERNLDFELVKKIEIEQAKLDPNVEANGSHFVTW